MENAKIYVMAHKGTLQMSGEQVIVFEAEIDSRSHESGGKGYAMVEAGSDLDKELQKHPAVKRYGTVWPASAEEEEEVLGPRTRRVAIPTLSQGFATSSNVPGSSPRAVVNEFVPTDVVTNTRVLEEKINQGLVNASDVSLEDSSEATKHAVAVAAGAADAPQGTQVPGVANVQQPANVQSALDKARAAAANKVQ